MRDPRAVHQHIDWSLGQHSIESLRNAISIRNIAAKRMYVRADLSPHRGSLNFIEIQNRYLGAALGKNLHNGLAYAAAATRHYRAFSIQTKRFQSSLDSQQLVSPSIA
jgi:hypothetical protein